MNKSIRKYKILDKQIFTNGKYQIVPIRDEDKYLIMQWRNEQMYHLRQNEILTKEQQEKYYKEVVDKLFEQNQPEQILFSYLHNDKCIGYGGLVHIDWNKKTAEVSFIMDTKLEKDDFGKHWTVFLSLLEQVAFQELSLNKIFTYAYDLRPHLYKVLEKNGFVFANQILNNNQKVLIHEKYNPTIKLREADTNDIKLIFTWSNDEIVRQQSYQTESIKWEEHITWYRNKLEDKNAFLYILEIKKQPAALVRFQNEKSHSVIGIMIDKKFRGQGLGSIFLNLAIIYYWKTNKLPVWAYIKKDNIASIKAFEKAGFIYKKDVIIKNVASVLYEKVYKV